ncbi:MAG: hypothetical protein HOQ22_11100, partial [Nocardioidaceae bacterium]|nr:hypothetical protein [Nocardioidaceae bacterium]
SAALAAWGPPAELLRALRATARDWSLDVALGLAAAAATQRHPGWAETLLASGVVAPELVPLLPEERLLQVLSVRDDPDTEVVLLGGAPGPWTPALTRRAMRLLTSRLLAPPAAYRFAADAAHRMDLSATPEVARLVLADRRLAEAATVLDARAEIARTFADPTPEHP